MPGISESASPLASKIGEFKLTEESGDTTYDLSNDSVSILVWPHMIALYPDFSHWKGTLLNNEKKFKIPLSFTTNDGQTVSIVPFKKPSGISEGGAFYHESPNMPILNKNKAAYAFYGYCSTWIDWNYNSEYFRYHIRPHLPTAELDLSTTSVPLSAHLFGKVTVSGFDFTAYYNEVANT